MATTATPTAPAVDAAPSRRRAAEPRSLFDPAILRRAVGRQLRASSTRGTMARNPVMFVVEIGSVLTTILFLRDLGVVDGARERLRRAGRRLAVVHRAVRQLRRGDGRGPGQGAGRHAAQDPVRDRRPASQRADGDDRGGAVDRSSTSATSCVVTAGRGDPRRRRGRRGHRHASTSRPSPASRRRSSASPAATARRSPAAPGCCPTRSSCASPPSPARRSSTG